MIVLEDQWRHLVGDKVPIGPAGTVRIEPRLLNDPERPACLLLQPDQIQRAVQLGVGRHHDRAVGGGGRQQRVWPGVVAGVSVRGVHNRVEEANQIGPRVAAGVPAVLVVEAPALEVELYDAALEPTGAAHSVDGRFGGGQVRRGNLIGE